ncbi:MAG: fused MFS/spermidine synthase [Verrucomicrobiales bacterium]|nr:fused MFS/spermidine synthase [Verrucomicrobiales bacterium]
MKSPSPARAASLICVLSAVLFAILYIPKSAYLPRASYGQLLHEETSAFSRIRVRGTESKRHLLFVADSGTEQLQSTIDLNEPGELQVAYTKTLFASLLFHRPQNRVLLIGLGGGGMVRFVDQNLPDTVIEAVEIDPAVVRLAAEYFETRENDQVVIHTEDAFVFLQQEHQPFDAIYLDAFLRPSVDKETDGKTARLKTVEFLETMRDQLTEQGVLACNLISYRSTTPGDLESLREVFPTVEVFGVPGTGNLAVIASRKEIERTPEEWLQVAKSLETELAIGLPFSDFVREMQD